MQLFDTKSKSNIFNMKNTNNQSNLKHKALFQTRTFQRQWRRRRSVKVKKQDIDLSLQIIILFSFISRTKATFLKRPLSPYQLGFTDD